jgi:hypothetical protein
MVKISLRNPIILPQLGGAGKSTLFYMLEPMYTEFAISGVMRLDNFKDTMN